MDRQLLARATESTDAPTPGYMYLDIAKNAASNPAVCQEVAVFLTRRLSNKNNPNVKYKCLKVIAKTATSPYLRGQFKRAVSQDPSAVGAIREALQFRGRPDPVRGDEPFERVRTAAKEALDAIYSDTPADNGGGNPPFATSMSGYGSQSQAGGYGGGYGGAAGGAPPPSSSMPGSSGRRMEGIGNPMFQDPRLQQTSAGGAPGISGVTIGDVVREAKDTVVGMIKDPLAKNANVHGGGRVGSMPRPGGAGSYAGAGALPPGRNELANQTGGQWTMASNRGPNAITAPDNFNSTRDQAYFKARDGGGNAYAWAQGSGAGTGTGTTGGVGGSWASSGPGVAAQAREPSYSTASYGNTYQATPSIGISGGAAAPSGGGGSALSDGSYEKNLIMELCPPGGMKAEPPQDKLNTFSRSVSNLNADLVCPALLDCLEEGQPWIIRAKALCVIEACIKFGQKPGAQVNAYADFFHACQGEITPLMSHNRAAIRDPATRVAKLLGVDASTQPASAAPLQPQAAPPLAAPPATAPPPPAAPVTNLLDFDSAPPAVPTAPPPAVAPPAAAPPAASSASLFGGLTMSGAPPAAAPPAPAAPAPAAPPAAPMSGNLLDLMGQSAQPAAAAAPTPAATSAPVTQTASMFDNMSLKTADAVAPAAPQAAETIAASAAPTGSAFGFINQAAPAATAPALAVPAAAMAPAATAAAPAATATAVNSFDPLSGAATPNTAQRMMQVSPEQMQAMAYQQMMMQRQMQMMAYQQQMMTAQKRGSGVMMPPGGMAMPNPGMNMNSFNFAAPANTQRQDDKSFDFVKDAITSEKKK